MYDGVKAMITREKELMALRKPKAPERIPLGDNVVAGSHLKRHTDITGLILFPDNTKSLLSKYLSKEIMEKYFRQTDSQGVSFEQMILSGV
jgi:hypothetical protein